MPHPAWEKLLVDCCASTEYMSLATHGYKGLWVNPVYFAHDPHFTFYFISQLGCVHMDNINSNKEVACAIYPSNQSTFGDVYGAYIKGIAEILTDEQEKHVADDIYYRRKYPDDPDARQRGKTAIASPLIGIS